MIEQFCKYFEGYFNNQKQAFANPSEFALIEIEHHQISNNKFKASQKYNTDPNPYRKTIIELIEKDDYLILKNYKDNEEMNYIPGCDVIMEYKDGKFYGKNSCKDCIVPWGEKTTYLLTESILDEYLYQVIDKGINIENGDQIWGSFNGFFQFDKIKSFKDEE
jgi:CpeT protein